MAGRPTDCTTEPTPPKSCEWVNPSTLQAWHRNPKDHSAASTNDLARSIRRFGFTDPIEVWRSKQQIVSGHGRLLAVNLLLTEDPGRILATDAPAPAQVLVRWLEFPNQDEADAYALAANRHNERNPMNSEKVAEIAADFEERGVEHEGIGFTEAEWQAMIGGEEESGAAGDQSDQLKETFQVLVTCADEDGQSALLAELHARGLDVRSLIT